MNATDVYLHQRQPAPASEPAPDGRHIFWLKWIDPAPDATTYERLMRTATEVVDAWIASRL